MKGAKPKVDNVVPMKGDALRHVPDAPDFMSDEGRAVWARLAAMLVAKDRLQPHFADMFAAYCEAVADFIRFTGDIAMMGSYFTTKTRNGDQEKKRAAWGQRQDALATMRQLSAVFGMSPVDEARISAGGQGDLFADILDQISGRNHASD